MAGNRKTDTYTHTHTHTDQTHTHTDRHGLGFFCKVCESDFAAQKYSTHTVSAELTVATLVTVYENTV